MNVYKDNLDNINNNNNLCPNCTNPLCIVSNENKNIMKIDTNGFIIFKCNKCNIHLCYILCVYCNKKIYMKIHPKNIEYNGLNGFNIRCPYFSCGKYFYFSECIRCKRIQKQNQYIKEGTLIRCIYKDCQCEYLQVHCPIKYCTDILSIEKQSNNKNYPSGILTLHPLNKKQMEVMHQKINCYHCWRPIVFSSTLSHKNRYIEGQKVECPYSDCKKSFNRIICPFCYYEIYFNNGWYRMGSKIKCDNCKNFFGKIMCVSCERINELREYFFMTGVFKCGYEKCSKKNYLVNCLFCRKLNVFHNKIPIYGQKIKCGYCQNTFNEIICPFCLLLNPFGEADFSFGKIYKCKYSTCFKQFQFLVCPNCLENSFIKEKIEGKKYKCDKCKVLFLNWGCPFCKSSIMDKESTLNQGQMIKCPSKQCGKIYSFIRCSGCSKLIFSKENENLMGIAVSCPYRGCGVYTVIVQCPSCKTSTIFSGLKENINEGKNITCSKCKKNYRFQKHNKLYDNNLTILEEINGECINFGIGEIDENFLMKQNLLIKNESSDLNFSIVNTEQLEHSTEQSTHLVPNNKNSISLNICMVCHNNLKESIFYPCAHRCTCYNCALILFEVNKKCPKCNQEIKCIIKKVFE